MISPLAQVRANREAIEAQQARENKRNAFLTKWSWRIFILVPMLLVSLKVAWLMGYESGYLHGALHRLCVPHL